MTRKGERIHNESLAEFHTQPDQLKALNDRDLKELQRILEKPVSNEPS